MKFAIYTRGSHLCFFYIQYNSTLVALLVSPLFGEMFVIPFPTVKPSKPKGSLGITMNVAPYCSMLYINGFVLSLMFDFKN